MKKTKELKMAATLMATISLAACASEELYDVVNIVELKSEAPIYEGEIKHFASAEDVSSAIYNFSGKSHTKSDDGFISYLETVMSEPGYDDLPYAILSDAFGAILNQNGELVFDNNLIHVSNHGILYGSYDDAEVIRELAIKKDLPSLCKMHGLYPPLSNSNFYIVDGYKGIYLYDTFGIIDNGNNKEDKCITRANDILTGSVKQYNISSTSDEVKFRWQENGLWRENWGKQFTIPSASEQKQVFSDGKHCNDTKIYHQDYGIAKDTGLKTKTMKKRTLGYWDKISGDMEAGIIELSVFEQLPTNLSTPQSGICTINFGGKSFAVKNVGVGNHGLSYYLQTLTWASVESAANDANVDAIRYIDMTLRQAITFFPNQTVKKTTDKIEMGFRVPFGGISKGPGYSDGSFHVIHQKIFGVTVRDNEIRGTEINYNY